MVLKNAIGLAARWDLNKANSKPGYDNGQHRDWPQFQPMTKATSQERVTGLPDWFDHPKGDEGSGKIQLS